MKEIIYNIIIKYKYNDINIINNYIFNFYSYLLVPFYLQLQATLMDYESSVIYTFSSSSMIQPNTKRRTNLLRETAVRLNPSPRVKSPIETPATVSLLATETVCDFFVSIASRLQTLTINERPL